MHQKKNYLKIGSAKDLQGGERAFYRLLEMFPGSLVWLTFALIVFGSIFFPFETVIFIIVFDLYWFLKTVYLTWHLRASFKKMREYLRIDWVQKLEELDLKDNPLGIYDWKGDLWHLVVLPFYKEEYEILESTFQGILAANYPKHRMMIVLSGEERRGKEAEEIGEKIAKKFGGSFGKFIFTMHQDQPGELAGKGANETWAAREAKEKIIDEAGIPYEKVVVSVFDVDTIPSPDYFARLTYAYLTVLRPLRTSFQPVPFFINNIWEAGAISRVMAFSSSFWHLMNQMRPERLVSFSSHAFSLKSLVEMNFWQTNVVSEDSRIFWQGLFTFDGDWRVEPLLIPVSMDANVAETFWQTMKNIYLQQRRWAYGVADYPYVLYGFFKNNKIPKRTKAYWILHQFESWWSWPTNSIIIFLTGWLPLFLGGRFFATTVLAHNVPRLTSWIMSFAMFGIITSIYLTIKLLPPKPLSVGQHKYLFMVLQWVMVPVTLVFSSIPAIEAETRLMLGKYLGFWPTPKIRKGIQKVVFGA
ncbi:MAG: glycosyltransferase family 2 protein [Candidatus Sungbacteria bacterium]|nr:glycosyltransferase family 2 protein [Candidatus Sungbacteria bacterium]